MTQMMPCCQRKVRAPQSYSMVCHGCVINLIFMLGANLCPSLVCGRGTVIYDLTSTEHSLSHELTGLVGRPNNALRLPGLLHHQHPYTLHIINVEQLVTLAHTDRTRASYTPISLCPWKERESSIIGNGTYTTFILG